MTHQAWLEKRFEAYSVELLQKMANGGYEPTARELEAFCVSVEEFRAAAANALNKKLGD